MGLLPLGLGQQITARDGPREAPSEQFQLKIRCPAVSTTVHLPPDNLSRGSVLGTWAESQGLHGMGVPTPVHWAPPSPPRPHALHIGVCPSLMEHLSAFSFPFELNVELFIQHLASALTMCCEDYVRDPHKQL